MDDILQDTLEVSVDGETYIFTIPSFADEIKLGMKERDIRRSMEREVLGPDAIANGDPTNDPATEFVVRTAAQFEVLLLKGPRWPYSPGPKGEPVVDYTKWPKNKVETAFRVGVEFQTKLRSFRDGGTTDQQSAGEQAVASQSDTSVQPLSPGAAAA